MKKEWLGGGVVKKIEPKIGLVSNNILPIRRNRALNLCLGFAKYTAKKSIGFIIRVIYHIIRLN